MHSLVTGRRLPFYNQSASMNAASDFTPDSQHLLIYSTAAGSYSQIFMTNVDGGRLQRITHCRIHRRRTEGQSEDRRGHRFCARIGAGCRKYIE